MRIRLKNLLVWAQRKLIFAALILIMFMIYAHYNRLPEDPSVNVKLVRAFQEWVRPFNEAEKKILERKGYGYRSTASVQSRFCLLNDDVCYYVLDTLGKNPTRQLFFLNYDAALSGAHITVENGRIKLKHDYLPFEYTRALVGAPFAYGSVGVNDEANFLLIGMGMGAMNSFLANLDEKYAVTVVESNPAMPPIARRWFNLNDELRNHHVIVTDGVEYIRQSVLHKRRFDAILIDACVSSFSNETRLGCPIAQFRTPVIIKQIHKLLTDKGVVAFNIASLADYSEYREESAAFRKMCARNFHWCTYLDFLGSDAFICGKSTWIPPPNGTERWDYQRRVGALPERMRNLFAVDVSQQLYEAVGRDPQINQNE